MFAAFLKLIIPFIVVIPGILAYNLFQSQLKLDAVNRNAQILSEYSSELYVSLSDGVKPDRELARNKNIVTKIEENLSRGQRPAKPYVYKFDAVFAGLHPQDAAAVVAYDLRQVEGRLTVDRPCVLIQDHGQDGDPEDYQVSAVDAAGRHAQDHPVARPGLTAGAYLCTLG